MISSIMIKGFCKLPYPIPGIIFRLCPTLELPFILGGPEYIKKRDFLMKSQWWSKEKLEEYQLKKLKFMINHAYSNVHYYRNLFKKLKLKPEDINSFKDLEKLPILTREDVVKNFNDLISVKAAPQDFEICETSGSTGKPLKFYLDKENKIIGHALYARVLDSAGHRFKDRSLSIEFYFFLRNNLLKDNLCYNKSFRHLYFSSKAHTPEDFDLFIKVLKSFKPKYIEGNPSVLYLIACHAEEQGVNDVRIKSFFSYAENLYNFQREKIKKVFDCNIFDCYGTSERVVSAAECENHQGLHVDMERGILEIVDEEGKNLPQGRRGRILATGLNNFAMPFIRYEMNDIGSFAKKECTCGRESPLINPVDGRRSKVLKYGNRTIYQATLAMLIWEFDFIKECQFVKSKNNCLTLRIVKREGKPANTSALIGLVKKVLNDDKIKVDVEFIDFIPRNRGGKFDFIIIE